MNKSRVPDIYSKDGLPDNWEMLTDTSTGWPYFANHQEKITTWEDPRPGMAQYHPSKNVQAEDTGIKKRDIPIKRRTGNTMNNGTHNENEKLTPEPNVQKRSPSPQPTLSPLESVQLIANEANKLQDQVSNFKDDKSSKEYKYLEEMLTRLLLKLDGVESEGKVQIRDIRREAVKTVQASIDQLELKAMSITEQT